jgi:hypothetical protein
LRALWNLSAGAIPLIDAQRRRLAKLKRARHRISPSWPGEGAKCRRRGCGAASHHPLMPAQAGIQPWIPAIGVRKHAVLWTATRGDERRLSQRFTFQTANSTSQKSFKHQVFKHQVFQTHVRHHPYCLARPRVGPSSRCPPSKMRGMARQGAQPLFFVCPHSLSEIRGAAWRADQDTLARSGLICGRLPSGAGPRFSWPSAM